MAPMSYNATLVLQALSQGLGYGFEIMRATHLASGTVYPILRRLESSGHVSSSWEDAAIAQKEGRPARRYYQATDEGLAALAEARERVRSQQALFGNADLLGDGAGG